MATDSIAGLFTDPYTALQQQSSATDQRAAQFAQMTPLQQAQFGIYGGASRLGGGLAGLMGVEDPQMKLQSARQSILRNVDQTDPNAIATAAQQLAQVGDQQGAMQLAELSRSAALKKAQAEKAMRNIGATTVSERNREMIANAEIKLAKKESLTPEEEARVRWLIGQENKPKIFRDSETGEITTIEPIDLMSSAPNLAALVGKTSTKSVDGEGVKNSTGGIGTVTTTPATKLSSSIKKEVGNVDEQMTILDTSVKKITELTPKIENLNLGLYQNVERGISGFLGKPTADTKEFKQLQREVRSQANNLLLLAKGTQTEGDAQRAKDQIADEDTWKNRDLLTSAFNDLATTLSNTKQALQAKRTTLTSSGIPTIPGLSEGDIAPKKNPLFGANPQLQPSNTAPRATHRYNPSTGRVEAL